MASLGRVAKLLLPEIAVDTVAYARLYRISHGVFPNIVSPRNFTEKVFWRSLFDKRPILRKFADKYAARCFVEERLGPDLLPKLYHLTEDPKTIPFDALPERFVVKPEQPFEAECEFEVPRAAMHSFKSEHNKICWRLLVHGDAVQWPPLERAFSVTVYPDVNAGLPS